MSGTAHEQPSIRKQRSAQHGKRPDILTAGGGTRCL
jgi:hypothetical protein